MVNIAVIGCGYWGPNLIRNLNQLQEAAVVMICDLDPEKLKKMEKLYPGVLTTQDYAKVLESPEIDAVVVSTQAATHYQIIKDALSADKDVLSEKPLTILNEEAEELIKLARERERILMVSHTFLYNTAVRKMKEYIDDGRLGKIYYLHATRTHLGLIREDVNAVWDLAAHDISIFSFLLQMQPKIVSAVGGSYLEKNRVDVAFITLTYPNGAIGNIHVGWIDSNKVREVVVVGSKRRLLFDDLNGMEPLRVYEKGVTVERPYSDFGEFKLLLRDGDIISPKVESAEPLKLECQHFIHCIQTRELPLTDGVNGLNVVKVLNAVDRSLKGNGVPVEIR
ncbi:MAG: Gfo/Idh/MocA family oxidoreductase [bacterium]|nr:Gfo/Idh/MocA family oxidoreductase [bacterium]